MFRKLFPQWYLCQFNEGLLDHFVTGYATLGHPETSDFKRGKSGKRVRRAAGDRVAGLSFVDRFGESEAL
jgi:hypothetical protein